MGRQREMEKHSPAPRATQQIRPGTKSESALSEQHSAPHRPTSAIDPAPSIPALLLRSIRISIFEAQQVISTH
ncbi:GM25338 [Drosophila sechellia]|uniref:GD14371 n=2 Tax=melanogaster subgroup TaxID=32351 RepID=B4QR88_DROSI|nr:GM25338 [Drosophila sechellia]EDX10218.1 GD14371 [Drosophila simulans]